MKQAYKKRVSLLLILILACCTTAWGDANSSTCNQCGVVTTFTAEQIANEVLYCSNCGALTMLGSTGPSNADEKKGWEYAGVDIKHIPPDWGASGDPSEGSLAHSVDFIEGAATITSKGVVGTRYFAEGDTASGQITWSSPPKRTLKPGESFAIELKADLLRHDKYEFETICFGFVEAIYASPGGYESKSYLSPGGFVSMYGYDDKSVVAATNDQTKGTATTVYGNAPEKGSEGDQFTVRVVANGSGVNYERVQCDYRYVWTGTAGAASPVDSNANPDPIGVIPQIIDSFASEKTGDSQPVGVKTAVVVGVVSTLAAAAAAAAASSSAAGAGAASQRELTRKEEEEALNKKGDYRMVVNKTFGNTIESGRPDQVLYARMEQRQPDGSWVHVPAMDGQISIFMVSPVEGLHLDPPPLGSGGKGKGQALRLENEDPPAEAVIAFKFQGPDTYFQNNMTFKLGGKPEIKLQEQFCLLGTVVDVQEVEYSLTGFSGQPEVTLAFTSDLFELKLGKNKLGKTVILANATEKAGQMRFQRFVHRYPCEIMAKTDRITLKKKFQVHLCYEGIGTAYQGLKNNDTPDPMILNCFTDADKDKRLQEAFRLPLAVMRWSPSARCLEPDATAAEALKLEFTADTRSKNIKVEEAVKVVEEAAIVSEIETGPSQLKLDMEKKPALFRIYPSTSPLAGTTEIELILTVTDPANLLDALTLRAQLKPQVDFRGMINWFLNYPRGTEVSQFIELGDNAAYMQALEHIENRVYPRDSVPVLDNTIIFHRASGNYYEHGKGDIMRKPYIALQVVPKEIGDYDRIRSLYHELTHTLEDIKLDQRDGTASDGSERRAYFLQFIADAAFNLADAERTGDTRRIAPAIIGMYMAYHDGHVIGVDTIQQAAAAFGAKCTMTSHELFAHYATAYNGPHAEAIREAVLGMYFPGNVGSSKEMTILMGEGNQLIGIFQEEDGPFKGGKWTFRWQGGHLSRMEFEHPDYTGLVTERKWVPDKGLFLSVHMDMEDKKTKRKDRLQLQMDAGWVSPKRSSFERVKDFHTTWRTDVHTSDGILFNLTQGLIEVPSTTRWLPKK